MRTTLSVCRQFWVATLSCCVTWATAAQCAESPGASPLPIRWTNYQGVDGNSLDESQGNWTVVCFLGTECPLTKLYGQRLSDLASEFSQQPVRFVGVNANAQDSVADVKDYIAEFKLAFPIIKDADQSLAELFHATRTPEVFVLDPTCHVRYQGRIDDQYEPGIVRAAPTRHDLKESLKTLLAGGQLAHTKTTAVGCLITMVPKKPVAALGAPVTFARDVAPILNKRCVECHRPGEIGPFALTDYHEVIGWGEMMLEVIDQGRMPPWHADPRHGKFLGERHFPAEERAVLATWVNQGMPLGDIAEMPAPPKFSAGWHLPRKPDAELAMRDRPYQVPKEGTVDYQYFVVDPHWTEDCWISAAQVVPGDAAVVHHAIVFVRPPDGAESHGIGWMGAYVPGQRTIELPPGHARRVPAGSRLVFQMHYTPNGRATADRTRVGVWFAKPEEVTHEVYTRVALDHHFEIPPHAKDHKVQMRLDRFAPESRLLGMTPHMHLRGKSFRLEACRGEQRETLLSVPRYDFNWQHWYQFESSLALAPIDALEMEVHFDNSPGNPVNPAPEEFVTWGDQTWNEMAVAFLDISHPRGLPINERQKPNRRAEAGNDEHAAQQKIEQHVKDFLAKMDRNQDGMVLRDEAPLTFQRFGFRQMDENGDGKLERGEIESAARQRL